MLNTKMHSQQSLLKSMVYMELRLESHSKTAAVVETCQHLTRTSAEGGNSKQNMYENRPEMNS